jgi:hypothetical protein
LSVASFCGVQLRADEAVRAFGVNT